MMVQQGHDGDLADGGRISNTLINEQDISLSPWADHWQLSYFSCHSDLVLNFIVFYTINVYKYI